MPPAADVETADLIVYTCAIFPIVGPDTDKDTDRVIGMMMLLSEALVLLVQTMEYVTLGIGPALEKYDEWKSKKQHKSSLLPNDVCAVCICESRIRVVEHSKKPSACVF